MMVALLDQQKVWRAWIYFPVSDRLYLAERGGGAWRDGSKIIAPHHPDNGPVNGQINMGYFAPSERKYLGDADARFPWYQREFALRRR